MGTFKAAAIVILAVALVPQAQSQDRPGEPPAKDRNQGIVVDEPGRPVAGAVVRALRFDGHFTIEALPPGADYEIVFSQEGGRQRSMPLRIDRAVPRDLGRISWTEH